jgi:hypothetical protein
MDKLFMENKNKNGHGEWILDHNWKSNDLDMCLFMESDIHRLRLSFGHTSVNALSNVLTKTRPSEMLIYERMQHGFLLNYRIFNSSIVPSILESFGKPILRNG